MSANTHPDSAKIVELSYNNVEAILESSTQVTQNLSDLLKTLQEQATKRYEDNVSALQRLAHARDPEEFVTIYSALAQEGMTNSMSDWSKLAETTQALLTASWQPWASRLGNPFTTH